MKSPTKPILILSAISLMLILASYFWLSTFPELEVKPISKLVNLNTKKISQLVDLDGDGKSEMVSNYNDLDNVPCIYIENGGSIGLQHNFYTPWLQWTNFFFGDYDQNGIQEIYGVQVRHDSLFLSVLEYPDKVLLKEELIVGGVLNLSSIVVKGKVIQFSPDENGRVVLSIMGGYGAHPRNIFTLDIGNHLWKSTPDSIKSFQQYFTDFDFDKDGVSELVSWGRAPDNNHGDEFFSDQDSYIFIYDDQLQLKKWLKAEGVNSFMLFEAYNDQGYAILKTKMGNSEVYELQVLGKDQLLSKTARGTTLRQVDIQCQGVQYFKVYVEGGDQKLIPLNAGLNLEQGLRIAPNKELINARSRNLDHFYFFDRNDHQIYMANRSDGGLIPLELTNEFDQGPPIISEGVYQNKECVLLSNYKHAYLFQVQEAWLTPFKMPLSFIAGLVPWLFLLLPRKKESKIVESDPEPDVEGTLRINTRTGFEIIPLGQILYLKADGKYTIVETVDNGQVLSSINLGTLESSVDSPEFARIGRSIIINKKYLRKVDRKKQMAYFKVDSGIKEVELSTQEVKGLGDLF